MLNRAFQKSTQAGAFIALVHLHGFRHGTHVFDQLIALSPRHLCRNVVLHVLQAKLNLVTDARSVSPKCFLVLALESAAVCDLLGCLARGAHTENPDGSVVRVDELLVVVPRHLACDLLLDPARDPDPISSCGGESFISSLYRPCLLLSGMSPTMTLDVQGRPCRIAIGLT